MSLSRRAFMTAVGAGWAVDQLRPGPRVISGALVGASAEAGHRLRGEQPLPSIDDLADRCDVAILGGGVAGLSAAWRLAGSGLHVRLLELEPFLGGTSTWSDDGVVPHPWGAHYLPVPNPEARAALRLLDEMGVLLRWDAAGRPVFDPRVLCHAPQERLFYQGAWHPGLVPDDALSPAEREEMSRFAALCEELTSRRGNDGLPAFQIPIGMSSRDPDLLALDQISMARWLDREGFRTPFLRWYVGYATRVDFGADPEDTSAWAGLHYFSARKLASPELEGSHFLVWPEGNGRLVQALVDRAFADGGGARHTTGALATQVELTRRGATVTWLDVARDRRRLLEARAVVVALPAFVAERLLPRGPGSHLPERTSSPWLVANLHVDRRPGGPARARRQPPELGSEGAWDSVLFESKGLGYVDASHQLSPPRDPTVLTYFRAYGGDDPRQTRRDLLVADWASLADEVVQDLAPAHPDIREVTSRLDLVIWGHAMPRPRPGFLSWAHRHPGLEGVELARGLGWGHADTAGIALFEESQAAGVRAAEAACASAGIDLGESWV